MTILVDNIVDYGSGPRGHKLWCHMMSDDLTPAGLAELHAMAVKIGLRRSYFQNKQHFPHYDLIPSKRALALQYGAEAVHSFDLVKRCKRPLEAT